MRKRTLSRLGKGMAIVTGGLVGWSIGNSGAEAALEAAKPSAERLISIDEQRIKAERHLELSDSTLNVILSNIPMQCQPDVQSYFYGNTNANQSDNALEAAVTTCMENVEKSELERAVQASVAARFVFNQLALPAYDRASQSSANLDAAIEAYDNEGSEGLDGFITIASVVFAGVGGYASLRLFRPKSVVPEP